MSQTVRFDPHFIERGPLITVSDTMRHSAARLGLIESLVSPFGGDQVGVLAIWLNIAPEILIQTIDPGKQVQQGRGRFSAVVRCEGELEDMLDGDRWWLAYVSTSTEAIGSYTLPDTAIVPHGIPYTIAEAISLILTGQEQISDVIFSLASLMPVQVGRAGMLRTGTGKRSCFTRREGQEFLTGFMRNHMAFSWAPSPAADLDQEQLRRRYPTVLDPLSVDLPTWRVLMLAREDRRAWAEPDF